MNVRKSNTIIRSNTKRPIPTRIAKNRPLISADNETRYRQLLEQLPVGVYRTTPEGRIIEANPALLAMLGITRLEDLRDIKVGDLYIHSADRLNHLKKLEESSTVFEEFELRIRDGRAIWVRDFPRAIKDPFGHILYFDGVLVDITDRKLAELALNRSEKDYQNLFENAHDAILIISLYQEVILEANPRACELYGYSRMELLGMPVRKLSRDKPRGKTNRDRTNDSPILRNFETIHYRRDGSEMVLEVNAALMQYKGKPALLSISRDITERKRMENTIRRLAFHDYLTGLPNRLLLADRLQNAMEHARRRKHALALLFLDLDNFKEVNDTHGHTIGDQLLIQVAERLQVLLRRSDTVARMGGDEFTIVLSEVKHAEDALATTQKILDELRKPYLIDHLKLQVSGSIGVAIYPRDGDDGETLLRKADKAMYQVKARSRNDCLLFLSD